MKGAKMENKQTGFHINKESVSKLFPKVEIDILGYESPINIIMGRMRTEQENGIYKAIQDYGVDVDEEELIKALQYDREQYEKGYINGYTAKASEVALETVDDFQSRLRHIFLDMCEGNDYNTVNLLQIDSAIEALFDSFVAELKKKYTEAGE
jgi:hypothetical protein